MLAALGIALAGGAAVEAPRWFHRRYKPSPFDDLLAALPDRDSAARIGAAVLAETSNFSPLGTAAALRGKLVGGPLVDAFSADVAGGRLIEVRGWILPESLADLCALAAQAV